MAAQDGAYWGAGEPRLGIGELFHASSRTSISGRQRGLKRSFRRNVLGGSEMTGAQLDRPPALEYRKVFNRRFQELSAVRRFHTGKHEPLQTGSTSLTLSFSKATATHSQRWKESLHFQKTFYEILVTDKTISRESVSCRQTTAPTPELNSSDCF